MGSARRAMRPAHSTCDLSDEKAMKGDGFLGVLLEKDTMFPKRATERRDRGEIWPQRERDGGRQFRLWFAVQLHGEVSPGKTCPQSCLGHPSTP